MLKIAYINDKVKNISITSHVCQCKIGGCSHSCHFKDECMDFKANGVGL